MQNNSEVKIKIVHCSDPRLWYNDRLNEIFTLVDVEWNKNSEVTFFWVRTGDEWNTSNWIHQTDAEYVN